MDLRAVLSEVETWPVEDRLQLVERIWHGLADDELEPEVTEEVRTLLDARLARHAANPTEVVTWEAIVAHVRRPR